MSIDTRLSPFREEPFQKEKAPKLSVSEARELARQTMGVNGVDEIGLGLAGLAAGILVATSGSTDPGVLLSEALLPAMVILGLIYVTTVKLKRRFVIPRIGKVKPPRMPGIFSFYSFLIYSGLHYGLGGTGQIAFWQSIAVAWCAATFSNAMLVWSPRFFVIPLTIVTLLRLGVSAENLLLGVGLAYLVLGTIVFGRFLATTNKGDGSFCSSSFQSPNL